MAADAGSFTKGQQRRARGSGPENSVVQGPRVPVAQRRCGGNAGRDSSELLPLCRWINGTICRCVP